MKKLHLIAFCLFGCSDLISVFYDIDSHEEQKIDFLVVMQTDQHQNHMTMIKTEMRIDFLLSDGMLADHSNPNQQDLSMTDQGQIPIDQGQIPIDQGQIPIDQGQIPIDQGQSFDAMIIPCGENCPEMEMILIEAGIFNMGSENGTEHPMHQVQIHRNFYVGKTEVTVGQYRVCVDANFCSIPTCDSIASNWTNTISSNEMQPVNCINWHEARIFAKWVGGDLLTEAQWEYVAKAKGLEISYPWGNDMPSCQLANYKNCMNSVINVCTKTGKTTQGVCDLAGNVWEWVLDEWHDSYLGAPSDEQPWCNQVGCDSNISTNHVFRGGSYQDEVPTLRSTFRGYNISTLHIHNLGFRVAKPVH